MVFYDPRTDVSKVNVKRIHAWLVYFSNGFKSMVKYPGRILIVVFSAPF